MSLQLCSQSPLRLKLNGSKLISPKDCELSGDSSNAYVPNHAQLRQGEPICDLYNVADDDENSLHVGSKSLLVQGHCQQFIIVFQQIADAALRDAHAP
jgi:hypothetical protein